jgi:hypothetical protein
MSKVEIRNMKPLSDQINQLKREERILMTKCERARNQAEIWKGRMRIAMNDRFAMMYAEKAVKCDREAERAFKKSMRVREQWFSLLFGKEVC